MIPMKNRHSFPERPGAPCSFDSEQSDVRAHRRSSSVVDIHTAFDILSRRNLRLRASGFRFIPGLIGFVFSLVLGHPFWPLQSQPAGDVDPDDRTVETDDGSEAVDSGGTPGDPAESIEETTSEDDDGDGDEDDDSTMGSDEDSGEEATEEEEEEEEEKEELEFSAWRGGNMGNSSWVDVSVGGAMVDGNEASFQRRFQSRAGVFGGMNDFYWEQYVGDNGLINVGGRAVGGNEDYEFRIRYNDSEKGYLRVGFRQYRVFYDTIGGFHPPNQSSFPLDDESLYADHARFWAEAGLTLPDWPVFGVKYAYEIRDGKKDSTIWGPTAAAGGRGVGAAFRGIDERRHTIEGDVKHTIGNTDAGIGLRYERWEADNTLNYRREAGTPAQLFLTQRDGTDTDLFNVRSFTETHLNEKVMFTTGYGFTTLDTDISGSRVFGAGYDPIYDPTLARWPGYLNLIGGSRLNQHVMALNLAYRPVPSLSLTPSFRVESTGLEGGSVHQETPGGTFRAASSDEDFLDLSQRVEVRYTGLRDWVFYGRGDWAQRDGDLQERQIALATGAVDLRRDTDFTQFHQKYTGGANWYPMTRLSFSGQYYYRVRENDYAHPIDSTSNVGVFRYPAYLTSQDFRTHDVNFRVTARPFAGVVSVSRYDHQVSVVDTGGNGIAAIRSADLKSHIFSQSLSWTPVSRVYLSGHFNYVIDSASTPADRSPSPAGVVLQSENDYWSAGWTAGYVWTQRTDLELEYQFSRADNHVDHSAFSQSYGAGFEEQRVFLTVTTRVHENFRILARYGYATYDDATHGGQKDFDAHLLYAGAQYRF